MPRASSKKSASRSKPRTSGQRAGLTKERVIDAAAALVDEEGLPALTLARLASELGVKTPSLYSHVGSLGELFGRLKLRGLLWQLDVMRRATVGRAGTDALRGIADAQRHFAKEHPGLHAATVRVGDDDPADVQAVGRDLLEVVLAVLRGYGLEGDDALHATRALRAATRGFIDLELQGGFGLPLEVEESYERLLALLDKGLRDFPKAR